MKTYSTMWNTHEELRGEDAGLTRRGQDRQGRVVKTTSTKRKPRQRPVRVPASAGGPVQSLARALALLRAIAGQSGGVSLTDLAGRVGLAPSTTHRLLMTLKRNGMVHDDGQGRWLIGVEAFVIGSAFVRDRNLVEIARPVMRQLMREAEETVNLVVEDQGEAVYLAQVECEQLMRVFSRPGARVPMHSSGVGKALLAVMPPDRVGAIVRRRGMARITEKTIDSSDRLKDELSATLRRGYAIDDEEHALGLRCVAAAIRDSSGLPLAAISISGPVARMSADRVPKLGARVAQAAMEISRALGAGI
jgi:IclR family acetate operon transcriptional repressor